MSATIRIKEIEYVVVRESAHPTIAGRSMLHLKRPSGAKKYVAIKYETGKISSVQTI